ncbi:cytochrome C oxidase subunit IV family protein [Granulicella cerasi]|uniref:Cytochrome C oxidase subunit IV family protein n=1 Tax=Granulicella cerasi TaxID=741063 RepID=A0ABW1Z8R8_9BACT|nr:cytochrome C oxidase subunit IV family protein [Granulicella cerasi]
MAHSIQSNIHTDKHDPVNVTNPEHAEHHIVSPMQYVMVYLTLLVFTGITVGAAFIDMGALNPVIALAIASIKMVIVLLFFMHAKYQSRLIKMTIGSGFFIFLVLVTMTLTDYMSRAWGRW